PSTSRPASVSGRVSTWIGNAWVMPRWASASTSEARTPRSAKVLWVVTFRCLSGIGGAVLQAKTPRGIGTRWRDCRMAKSIAARQARAGCTDHLGAKRELWAGHQWDEEAFHDGVGMRSYEANVAVSLAYRNPIL